MRYRRYRRRRYRRLPYPIINLSRSTSRYNPTRKGTKRKYEAAQPYDPSIPYKKLIPTDRYYSVKKGNLRSNQFRDWKAITTARAIDQYGWISDTAPYRAVTNWFKRAYSPKAAKHAQKRQAFANEML